jgi:hypothetical protein
MIKKVLVILALLSVVASAASVNWEKSLDSAIAKGKKEHKPVMFLVSRDGCGWCDRFRAGTLSNPEVVKKLNSEFVSFEGYTNRGTVPRDLITNGTPGTWFIKDDEPMYQPLMGAYPVAQYLEALNVVLKEYKAKK